jgi:peptidoglycan hydrolase CwlO-like protein
MFVLQFVALDIGGMGLRQLAQRHGLEKGAYTYKIANACIAVTFATLIFAGLQHATTINPELTTWVEVILVIARSGLTVLYGQAIRALKFVEQTEDNEIAALQEEMSNLRLHVSNEQQRVSSLQTQLDSEKKKVSSVQSELERRVSDLVSSGQAGVSSVQLELDRATTEVSSLRIQLDGKEQQITSLQEALGSGMKLHENSTQQIVSSVQRQLDKALTDVSSLQEQVSSGQQEIVNLRGQLDSERMKVSSLQDQLDSQRVSTTPQKVSSFVSSGQSEGVQLDTEEKEQDISESTIEEQIRAILVEEPGLSGRAIAARVGCSPTTASTWKKAIEQELSIVPHLHVVNE